MQEDANSKLAAVVTDVRGLWACEILQRLRDVLNQAAVVGRLEAHHIFLLRAQRAWPLRGRRSRCSRPSRVWPGAPPRCSLPRAAPTSRASPLRSTWPSEPGCAPALPRAAAEAAVAGPVMGTAGCGVRAPRSPTSRAGRRAPTWPPHSAASPRAGASVARGWPSGTRSSSPASTCSPDGSTTTNRGAQSFDEHARAYIQRRLVRRWERLGFTLTLDTRAAYPPDNCQEGMLRGY
ncbi:MAG TPA: hypothetical protein VGP82_13525, partial [Ktedonobacterales bacterium]|nr:hypothetical protein [Ktedonobacterales bacterium]